MKKYIILLGDGMGDYGIDELDGKTPLSYAKTPNMDYMANHGLLGRARTIPEGAEPGSDIANMSVLGYDPFLYHTGRSPLEAASMGVDLAQDEIAFRCNLVTLDTSMNSMVMDDYSADHITTKEARIIINDIQAELGTEEFRFYPGVSYRHLMVWKRGIDTLKTRPPHDLTGQDVSKIIQDYKVSRELYILIENVREMLKKHPVNIDRMNSDKKPANAIWLWGQGRAPVMPSLKTLYGLEGGMISAVDLLKGLGIYAGLKPVDVHGATGYLDTNYKGKVDAAIDILSKDDFIYIHVEAPDEASHKGNLRDKLKAIEDFDGYIVGSMLSYARKTENCRILLLPDHYTPILMMTHTSEPVPFCLFDSSSHKKRIRTAGFNEAGAEASGLYIDKGHELLPLLLGSEI